MKTNTKSKNRFQIAENVSIIIPTHERPVSLSRLLDSIETQRMVPSEVIVVNDGSNGTTVDLLENWKKQEHAFVAIVFHNPRAGGPGVARNIGIQLASKDIIAFTDDDCLLHPSWIQNIRASKHWAEEEGVVGIGGRVLPLRKGLVSKYYTFHRILEPPKYNQYLVTANACYLRRQLMGVGGFDESHRFPGGEDNALSFKLTREGYKLGYDKNIIVYHDYRTSIPNFLKTFYRYGRGCAEISRIHLQDADLKSRPERRIQNDTI